jgi:hypothetical protein
MNPLRIRSKKQIVIFCASLGAAALAFASSPAPVNLRSAGNFSILAKTHITTTGATSIVGNIGISPAAASFITGFGLIADASNQFATSSLINGDVYAADYAAPTPSIMTTAIGDMQTAYTYAAGQPAGATNLYAGNIGGQTFLPGVYSWGTGVTIQSNLVLTGSSSDVWIFQIASTLDISAGIQVILSGGAQAQNIFWQVGGQTTLETTSVLYGTILDQTEIVLKTGATLNGKALAQSQVTLDANKVISSSSGYLGPNPPQAGKTFAYPSPDRGNEVTIVFHMTGTGNAAIRIWNANGELAASVQSEVGSGPQKIVIPIANFAPGIYLYKVVLTYDAGTTQSLDVQKFGVIR